MHAQGSQRAARRDQEPDLFGLDTRVGEGYALVNERVRSHDMFAAELAAVLSRGIRHVVAPPSATWRHAGNLHDSAMPFAKQVRRTLRSEVAPCSACSALGSCSSKATRLVAAVSGQLCLGGLVRAAAALHPARRGIALGHVAARRHIV
jgi:hypothetical protein